MSAIPSPPSDSHVSAAFTVKTALLAVNEPADFRSGTFRLGIGCGFTPLHLDVLMRAYVQQTLPTVRASVLSGTYGDLAVALSDLAGQDVDGQIVFIEWSDIDPRLSARRAGSAAPADLTELAASAHTRLARFAQRIADVAALRPVVVVPPTLPLPPYFPARAGQVSAGAAALRAAVADFVLTVSANRLVRVLDPLRGAHGEGSGSGYDLRMDLKADFPYTVDHASRLARDSVALLLHPPAKKGLITDLDDTLWRGLVGEVGVEEVSWKLDAGSQVHAMYQQLLARLAAQGVLVGVVSKNEQAVAQAALARPDLIVPVDKIFPVIASWRPKSQAVSDVLRSWNIAASDVVMVDDSPLELAEIHEAHPDMVVERFEPGNAQSVLALIGRLEDMFVRDSHSTEDDLRVASLRSAAEFDSVRDDQGDYQAFLKDVAAEIVVRVDVAHEVDRAYELVQKTNQFNLNGRRQSTLEWKTAAGRPGAISLIGDYTDRFGVLGNVSVLTGTLEGTTVTVDCWVLSCRAFSRAMEHHMLRVLVDVFHADRVDFDYLETARNAPIRAFLDETGAFTSSGAVTLSATTILDHPLASIHGATVVHPDAHLAREAEIHSG